MRSTLWDEIMWSYCGESLTGRRLEVVMAYWLLFVRSLWQGPAVRGRGRGLLSPQLPRRGCNLLGRVSPHGYIASLEREIVTTPSSTLQYTTVYHSILQYISLYTTVHYSTPQYITVYYNISHSIPLYTTVHHSISQSQ